MLHEMIVLWIQNHQEEWEKITKKDGAAFTGEMELVAEFRKLCEMGVLLPEMGALFGLYLSNYEEELGFGKENGLVDRIMGEEQGRRKMTKENDGKLYVNTPFGILVAYSKGEPDNPGICIDLRRVGSAVDAPLILTEYTATEGDVEEGGHIITRVWGAVTEEDYRERIVHTNIELFFADKGNKC